MISMKRQVIHSDSCPNKCLFSVECRIVLVSDKPANIKPNIIFESVTSSNLNICAHWALYGSRQRALLVYVVVKQIKSSSMKGHVVQYSLH